MMTVGLPSTLAASAGYIPGFKTSCSRADIASLTRCPRPPLSEKDTFRANGSSLLDGQKCSSPVGACLAFDMYTGEPSCTQISVGTESVRVPMMTLPSLQR